MPSQYSKKRIEELQKNDFSFAGQYQQNPISEGGNLFKADTFIELSIDAMPNDYDYSFITADLSYKATQLSDFTVFSYWGVKRVNGKDRLYLRDVMRKKINAVEIEGWIEPWLLAKIRVYGFRQIWIEDKGHGIALNQAYRNKGYPVPSEELLKKELPRTTDKVERANNIIPCLSSTEPNLFLCSDIKDFPLLKEELLGFNNAKNDDFVDNLIDAVKITFLKSRLTIFDVL